MNSRVSELTEMALQIMNYQMYDSNGTRTDSLSQVIQPHLTDMQDTGEAAAQPDPLKCNKRDEEQFMAEFGISDPSAILEDPVSYIDKQMASLFSLLDARIMQTKVMTRYGKKAEELRAKNKEVNHEEISFFTSKIKEGLAHAIYRLEVEVGATWSQTDQEILEAYEAKGREQLEEFNMLLDLLKIILDDIPDDWRELDKILNLMKALLEKMKSIE